MTHQLAIRSTTPRTPPNNDTQTPDTIHYYYQYYLPGVTDVLASGASTWIGTVNESTVLKYRLTPDEDTARLEVERKLLEIIGPHERIIQSQGLYGHGDISRTRQEWEYRELHPRIGSSPNTSKTAVSLVSRSRRGGCAYTFPPRPSL